MQEISSNDRVPGDPIEADRTDGGLLGVLLPSLVHDVNNSLSLVSGLARMLEVGEFSDTRRTDICRRIRAAASSASDLTRRALLLTRSRRPVREKVDLHEILAELAGILEPLVPERIEFHVEPDAVASVLHAEEAALQSALLNLCLNALEAMPGRGVLRISTRDASGPCRRCGAFAEGAPLLEITVADSGSGISGENLACVFEPFFTTRPDGTGLGLFAVANTVREHGGCIHLESRPGDGTRAVVRLPNESSTSGEDASRHGRRDCDPGEPLSGF
jgi:two-component system, cell cycle sensor histidine kinase and response regulator CckA